VKSIELEPVSSHLDCIVEALPVEIRTSDTIPQGVNTTAESAFHCPAPNDSQTLSDSSGNGVKSMDDAPPVSPLPTDDEGSPASFFSSVMSVFGKDDASSELLPPSTVVSAAVSAGAALSSVFSETLLGDSRTLHSSPHEPLEVNTDAMLMESVVVPVAPPVPFLASTSRKEPEGMRHVSSDELTQLQNTLNSVQRVLQTRELQLQKSELQLAAAHEEREVLELRGHTRWSIYMRMTTT
jgi:hypothetical protein